MIYLHPQPVRDLENWFYGLLRPVLDPAIFISFGQETEEQFVPETHVRIAYKEWYSSLTKYGYRFQLEFHSSGVANLNPHHDSLSLLELSRFTLWQKIPPRPGAAAPLLLESEGQLKPRKGCGCKPGYYQVWQAWSNLPQEVLPGFDPCVDAGEPGSVIPLPLDYISPFNLDWYYGLNPDYNNLLPNTVGSNAPWILGDPPIANANFDPNKLTIWGNTQVILFPYFKKINLNITPVD